MSTAAVKKLPPSYRPELEFDQSEGRFSSINRYPVSATFSADGPDSFGISWDDYGRMATVTHKLGAYRRVPTPQWSVNDADLRRVLCQYLEWRACIRGPQPGTEQARLQKALDVIKGKFPSRQATLGKLCKEYAALSRGALSDDEAKRKKYLSIQIQNLDTILRFDANIAKIVVGVVHCYYRRGLNSVDTAAELGIKPPHVRGLLWRLHQCWQRLESGWAPKASGGPGPEPSCEIDIPVAVEMLASGATLGELGRKFGCQGATVRKWLRKAGVYTAPSKERRGFSRTIDVPLAVELLARGATLEQLAQRFGCHRATVRRRLTSAGLYKSRLGRPRTA